MKNTWRKRIMDALSFPTLFAGAIATSTNPANAVSDNNDVSFSNGSPDPYGGVVLPNTLNATALDKYAAHRSHSSHGSHRSHRSSSGGGGGYTPSPSPTPSPSVTPYQRPAPAPSVTPSQPPTSAPPASTIPKPSPQDLSSMVVRAQAALMRLGYYHGDIDGVLGPETRQAIINFQRDQGLPSSGRLDIATLTYLGISIP